MIQTHFGFLSPGVSLLCNVRHCDIWKMLAKRSLLDRHLGQMFDFYLWTPDSVLGGMVSLMRRLEYGFN